MSLPSRALLALVALSSLSLAKEVGYFEPSSCADPKSLTICYEKVDANYSNCVNNNCAGGGQACYNSCGGSTSCMNEKCPGLGLDCIKACECEKSALQIDCAGQSCWNQVYSCEYQSTVIDFLGVCLNPNRDGLPYWPTPDDAPDSCSCNLGKVELKEYLINNQLTECSNNATNLNQMTDTQAMIDYGQACMCCGWSAIISAIWDTCPDTKPSLLSADEWFAAVLNPGKWEECGPYLEAYDCANDLGFGRADAGGTNNFPRPNSMPTNGTKTMSNVGGTVSTPVSGDTFTWMFGSATNAVIHTVTVSAADATATGTKAGSGASDITATGSSATGTAESDAKPGMGSSLIVPSWAIAGSVGALILSAL
ncbi:uncharacterized protein PGRI_069730 [Penicillium griseofulvum]|uniref:Uncharacterized protein n=1 Tax=Penicillium patulum TaxID=5078 RepID=A0A135LNE6_PENPA|nr:uncharacterized protein PGRI_069730 [Penicillium griseofulvum]KXG50482.1 hypothetical protein PGRI_069730 [Penicillium griseofulvum]